MTITPQVFAGSARAWIAFRDDGRYAFAVVAATGDHFTFDLDTGAQGNADGTQVFVFKRDRIDVVGASDGRKLRSVLHLVEPCAVVLPPAADASSTDLP